MSDLKVDGIIASTGTNTNLTLQGKGSGKVDIGDGALSFPDADGSANQVIKTDGSGALSFTSLITIASEQATTSGSSVTFGSIPAGVKLIEIMYEDVSMTAINQKLLVQIGDSGGIESSGYDTLGVGIDDSAAATSSVTGQFEITNAVQASAVMRYQGIVHLRLKESSNFTWTCTAISMNTQASADYLQLSAGNKDLSAELTQVLFGTGGTFDAGSVSIMYI
jgi:hypothetical protein